MRILLGFFFLTFCYSSVKALEVNDQAVSCPANLESENTQLDLQKYQGKVIYLDFWATWCPPCKKSMPYLNALRNEFLDQGFEIIAISVDENPEIARQFLQQHPVDYLIAMDPGGQCPKEYDVQAMPSAFFIDRKGKIRYIHLGFRDSDKEEIRNRVIELITENDVE